MGEPFTFNCPRCGRGFRVFPDNTEPTKEKIILCTRCGVKLSINFDEEMVHCNPGKHVDVFDDDEMSDWIEEIMEGNGEEPKEKS